MDWIENNGKHERPLGCDDIIGQVEGLGEIVLFYNELSDDWRTKEGVNISDSRVVRYLVR